MLTTETEAKARLLAEGVSRETLALLDRFCALVAAEQLNQNLVSASTLSDFWTRHILDAAQLVIRAERRAGGWLDIGSGAGIPGIVTAILTGAPTCLVEPRKRRAEFLRTAVAELGLRKVEVAQSGVEQLRGLTADIITARAVAPLPKLIAMSVHCANPDTLWILPKGRSAKAELESLPRTWQGAWAMHRSITDADSFILVGRKIRIEQGP